MDIAGGEQKIRKKHRIKRLLGRLGRIRTWQLLIIVALLVPVSLTLLRLDNLRMERLRTDVLIADEENNEDALRHALHDLQHFVFRHMNTSTGPFFLTAAYTRDAEYAIANAPVDDQNIHREAADICDPRFNFRWSWAYVECMRSELERLAGTLTATDFTDLLPNPELYRREFLAPRWSPTASGLSILLILLLTIAIIIRLLIYVSLKIALSILNRQKSP
ncbi:hypothetical protein FWH13_02995 [Candidatus Saccharibacteria bacterium]|nr:hypothetical protein [Candidatus Saccharibacteria bacterium]